MADRMLYVENLTFTPVGDLTAFTSSGYFALVGAATTQINKIKEVSISGLAAASAVMRLIGTYDEVIGATLTALATPNSNGPMVVTASALSSPPVGFIASTTPPQRNNDITAGKMNLAFNAFGSKAFWQAPPNGEYTIVGSAINGGEFSVSAFTGSSGGPVSAHIIYETI